MSVFTLTDTYRYEQARLEVEEAEKEKFYRYGSVPGDPRPYPEPSYVPPPECLEGPLFDAWMANEIEQLRSRLKLNDSAFQPLNKHE